MNIKHVLQTFSKRVGLRGLPIGKDGFDINAHIPPRRIPSSNDTESQTLGAGTLVKCHLVYREGVGLTGPTPRQSAELAGLFFTLPP